MLPDGRTGWTYRKDVRLLGERINIRQGDSSEGLIDADRMEDVITSAQRLRGVPYLWGGMSSKGVDCSGLVRICFLMNDILLPRNASQQVFCGKEIEVARPDIAGKTQEEVKENYDREKALNAIRNLGRGDLVFFGNTETGSITHVGIYLGGGQMIHASHLVRVNSLIPGEESYYENAHRIIRACRLW
jgi:cell wall-associated NlpC family hydrolase